MKLQKTFQAKMGETDHPWYVIDATDLIVGRLATRVATLLRGKNTPRFTRHADTGAAVVIVNAEKVKFTGNKLEAKMYWRHSGYPGGIKGISAGDLLEKDPPQVIEKAVRGMLPKTPLGRKMLKKLKVYAGPDHPHQAQQPESMAV